jgi:hypothetical protein
MCLVAVLGIAFSVIGDKFMTKFVVAEGEVEEEITEPRQA